MTCPFLDWVGGGGGGGGEVGKSLFPEKHCAVFSIIDTGEELVLIFHSIGNKTTLPPNQ